MFKKEHCDRSLSRTGWTAAGRGIFFNRLGKNRECSSNSSGMRTPEFPQVLGRGNLEKCSKQALLQQSVAAKNDFWHYARQEKMKEGCECDDSRD